MTFTKTKAARNSRKIASIAVWVALVVASIALIPWMLGPSCPQKIVIATGSKDGAYFSFAEQYRDELRHAGIELEIRTTGGSVENQQLLIDGEVDFALIQAGIQHAADGEMLTSLASLYHEPLWIFYRSDLEIDRLTDLKGQTISIGAEGSGTRDLALTLLEANQLTNGRQHSINPETNVRNNAGHTNLVGLSNGEARLALKNRSIDAMFMVVSAHSPLVQDLINDPEVQLLNMHRADAYCVRQRFLSKVALPEGYVDLKNNIPAGPVQLVAPSANLVARDDLHPALIPLLLDTVKKCHETGGVFESPGEFPNTRLVDFKLNKNSRRYFANGAPFFYRVLPFQIAAWLDRVKLLLLPICTLLLPLIKLAPPIYRWSIRIKIYRWYRILREIDLRMEQSFAEDVNSTDLETLDRIESELANVSVPLSYMEEFYNLRLHIDFVKRKLERRATMARGPLRIAA